MCLEDQIIRKNLNIIRNGIKPNTSNTSLLEESDESRKFINITRMLNEEHVSLDQTYVKSVVDKFSKYLNDLGINTIVEMLPLDYTTNGAFWGGNVGDGIQFVYKISPDDANNGVEFTYLEGFDQGNEKNKRTINAIKAYYDVFYKDWENYIQ